MSSYDFSDFNLNPNNNDGKLLILISYGFLLTVYIYYYVL